jgi:hypothetical protein
MRLPTMIISLALLCAAPAIAHADDPLTDSLGPRAIGIGEALRAAAVGSTATILNPAGAALSRSYVLEGNYGFRGQDGATIANASICDSTSRLAACAYYDYFNATPTTGSRKLSEAGVTLAIPIAERFLIGSTQKWVDYTEKPSDPSMPDNSRSNAIMMDLGMIIRATDQLNLALVGYNMVGHDKANFPRAVGTGIAAYLTPNFMLGADARWNLDAAMGTPGRYSGGAEYFIAPQGGQQGFPLRAGVIYDQAAKSTFVTAGIGYITPKIGLDIGMRKQVSGDGNELIFQFGLRLFMPN